MLNSFLASFFFYFSVLYKSRVPHTQTYREREREQEKERSEICMFFGQGCKILARKFQTLLGKKKKIY